MTEISNKSNSPDATSTSEKHRPTPNPRLRRERERRAWSQQDLADEVGTTPLNVGRWERGVTQPNPYFRKKLSEVFNKSAQELGLVSTKEPDDNTPSQMTPTTSSSTDKEATASLWNVPYRRNLFFTGREDILAQLRDAFMTDTSTIALAQPQAISGLGGIGKTQTAIEYAYRYRDSYQVVFWVRAESPDLLISDYLLLAALLNLPERNEQDQNQITSAVIRWFDTHGNWLLILDNADEIDAISEYIPSAGNGHILLTTRAQAVGTIAGRIDIDTLSQDDGVTLLLRRIKRLRGNASLESVPIALREQAQAIVEALDSLPLAIDQAGAYIEETGCNLSDYLKFYKTRRTKLLRMRGRDVGGHPEPVAATWSLAFENVERTNPAAADLLRLCAFLHPDAIPETMLIEGASELGSMLGPVAADELDLNEAIGQLLRYSLVKRDADEKVLNIHRLVQAVVRDGMKNDEEQMWAERTVRMVSKTFPDQRILEEGTEEQLQKALLYIPQAFSSSRLVMHRDLVFSEAARLLNNVAFCLVQRGQYMELEAILQHALIIDKQVLDTNASDMGDTLNNLAMFYHVQGHHAEAEKYLLRAKALYAKTLGEEHFLFADSLNELAKLYLHKGKFIEAEPLILHAIALYEQTFGLEHPEIVDIIDTYTNLLRKTNRNTEADEFEARAQSIRTKNDV